MKNMERLQAIKRISLDIFALSIVLCKSRTDHVRLSYRSVAQLGRALRSGRRGRGFESRRFDFEGIVVNLSIYKGLRLFCFLAEFRI